jgi:D-alanyl-lipoteichoic acid acyltransferase DltB (MBOAT superfamily)
MVAMTFCGLWHGVAWNFVIWGALQGVGLIWVGVIARDLGRRLPSPVVAWWRRSPVAYAASAFLSFTFFSLTVIFVVTDVRSSVHYLSCLFAR